MFDEACGRYVGNMWAMSHARGMNQHSRKGDQRHAMERIYVIRLCRFCKIPRIFYTACKRFVGVNKGGLEKPFVRALMYIPMLIERVTPLQEKLRYNYHILQDMFPQVTIVKGLLLG